MNRSSLNFALAACALAACVFGYLYYLEKQKTSGFAITIDENNISIEAK